MPDIFLTLQIFVAGMILGALKGFLSIATMNPISDFAEDPYPFDLEQELCSENGKYIFYPVDDAHTRRLSVAHLFKV